MVWVSTDDHCEPGIMLKNKKNQKTHKKIGLHLYVQVPASIALTKKKPFFWHILLQKKNRMFKVHMLILLKQTNSSNLSSPINISSRRSFGICPESQLSPVFCGTLLDPPDGPGTECRFLKSIYSVYYILSCSALCVFTPSLPKPFSLWQILN